MNSPRIDPTLTEPRPAGRELLPPAFAHPLVMLVTAIVPQLLLLWLNIADATRLSGLLEPGPKRELLVLTVSQFGLLIAGLAICLPALLWRRDVRLAWMPAWLAGSVGFAIAGMQLADRIVDANATFWLSGTDALGLRQAILVMPSAFLAGLRLACARLNLSAGRDITVSLAVMAGIPAGWYLCFTLLSSSWRGAPSETAMVVLFTLLTILVMLGLMRVTALVVRRWCPQPRSAARTGWLLVLGLLAPLGGLVLNAEIPFPFDFQNPVFYPLAVLNGLLLLLPEPQRPSARHALGLARAALFPYVIYFFVIFLPFTPFFLPALLFFGAGLLILAPTALFLVQGAVLMEHLREHAAGHGRLRAGASFLLALALLPGAFLARTAWHRATLHEALDYVYPGENAPPAAFTGNRFALRAVLDNVARARAESTIPFLSNVYNARVFDGLVLPEAKLRDLYRVFFNEEPPTFAGSSNEWGFASDGGRRRGRGWRMGTPPPVTGKLENVEWTEVQDTGFRRIGARVALHNPNNWQVEFADTIRLPPGALVTGFWLYIGEERVPGVIFEKKTALWVYETIRDRTRRDPGILVYQPDGTINFRVFPLEANQHRQVELEFSVPDAVAGTVSIGAQAHELTPARRNGIQVIRADSGGLRVVAGPDAPLPRFKRAADVHLLVDPGSVKGWETDLRQAVARARNELQAQNLRVRLGSHDLGSLPADENAVLAAARAAPPPAPGGFFRDRLVRQALWSSLAENASARPVVLLVSPGTGGVGAEEHPERLFHLAPDAVVQSATNTIPAAPEVVLLRAGGRVLAARPEAGGLQQCFPDADAGAKVEVFDPARQSFVALPEGNVLPAPGGVHAAGTALWLDQVRADTGLVPPRQPLSARVKASRESGVMLTSTSYIVVEQKVHWQALKEKEAAKLAGHSAFEEEDLTDTPEPGALFWALALAAWWGWQRFALRSRSVPGSCGQR